jgi:pyrimidine deaminase RibD-like protein
MSGIRPDPRTTLLMDANDLTFMKRALELARLGAGLVSPNPMVGAVLVRDGRVVGEGFHRYDRLRHAESYAIEMAGELARGATLYCSLEPCCHHGRTPPCTDGLIEAGIARAVIAARDTDSRVSGQGINQLRRAGVEVEVGLCERETIRLNETYFKYITIGIPFIHTVIESDGGKAGFRANWRPSREFLEMASHYDMIGQGSDEKLNEIVLNACLTRERHRQLIIIGSKKTARQSLPADAHRNIKVAEIYTEAKDGAAGNADLASILKPFAERLNVTGALLLPGFSEFDPSSALAQCDKITVIHRRTDEASSQSFKSISSNIQPDDEYAPVSDSTNYIELTGYPRRLR